MPLTPGQSLSFYRILGPLGAGGMGEVYRALDTRLDREVAIKVLPEELADDEERHARFAREARMLASLNHANVAGIHGVDEDGGVYFLALELIEGEELATRLARGRLAVEEAIDVCRQLASGVEAAHEAGVVHRDLKPSNVRITPEGVVKVLDFGLAKPRRHGADRGRSPGAAGVESDSFLMTGEGRVLGTPVYMSPEQARGKVVDRRTDVWSFGCVLFECLTGQRAFAAESFADLMAAIVGSDPDWSLLPATLPRSVRQLLARCLEKDARERLRDLGEARVILGRAFQGDDAGEADLARTGVRALRFTLKTEHVRRLESPVPSMIGDALIYLDNGRASEVLVIFLPGIGLDETIFRGILEDLPCRAVALSLFGFSPKARRRPALSLEDHNRLLVELLAELEQRVRPKRVILVGFSAGADQALSLLASESSARLTFDGLLLLSPAARRGMLPITRAFASLPEDSDKIVPVLKELGGSADSLEDWLGIHSYLVQAFQKFGSDPRTLRDHARSLIEPLERDPDFFLHSFRNAIERVRRLTCVFAMHEAHDLDWILKRHLEDDALGPDYQEEMICLSTKGHLQLADADVIRPYLDALITALETPRERA